LDHLSTVFVVNNDVVGYFIGFVEKWPLLSELQARLQENLGADGYQAAREQGEDLELSTAVEALLAEGK